MYKRYAISDLHGRIDLLQKVKEYVDDTDIIYALGDFGDRGPASWATLKAALDDPQIIYLMGNHDFMLVQAIEQYLKEADEWNTSEVLMCRSSGALADLGWNGGARTFLGWEQEPERMDYYYKLLNLPLEIRLAAKDKQHFIYLTHAGLIPGILEERTVEDFVWDRGHFYDEWESNGNLSIGGHTPIDYLRTRLKRRMYDYDDSKGYLSYNNNSKICIDMGTYRSNKALLLDLDTLKSFIFIGESYEEN